MPGGAGRRGHDMNANTQTGPLARSLSLRRNVARRAPGHQQASGRRPVSFRGRGE
jgi:hypothetical protein